MRSNKFLTKKVLITAISNYQQAIRKRIPPAAETMKLQTLLLQAAEAITEGFPN